MSLTKAAIAEHLYTKLGISKQDANKLVENFFTAIVQGLVDGNQVKISKFGNFSVQAKNARPGRNPKTGAMALVSQRRVIRFKQGSKLKELVNVQSDVV